MGAGSQIYAYLYLAQGVELLGVIVASGSQLVTFDTFGSSVALSQGCISDFTLCFLTAAMKVMLWLGITVVRLSIGRAENHCSTTPVV